MPTKFIKVLPFQAIEASLHEVEKRESWTNDSGDELWSLTHDENNFHHRLYAQVEEVNEVLNDGANKNYSIRLLKRNYPELVNISHRLIALGLASLSKVEQVYLFSKHDDLSDQILDAQVSKSLSAEKTIDGLINQFILNFIK